MKQKLRDITRIADAIRKQGYSAQADFLMDAVAQISELSKLAAKASITWMNPVFAAFLLADEIDTELGVCDGLVVKLDVQHQWHDGGPYLRQAFYDKAVDGFICAASCARLPNVTGWAYDYPVEV